MIKTYFSVICGDEIAFTADFAEASCPVVGDYTHGRQVADFRHRPVAAMRESVLEYLGGCGTPAEDREEIIEDAIATMRFRPVRF